MPLTLPVAAEPGQSLVVACVDLAVDDHLAAFRETYKANGGRSFTRERNTGIAYDASRTRKEFVDELRTEIIEQRPVALGIEGPLWGYSEGILGPYKPRPFEEKGNYAWYGAAGGPAALKALVILRDLLRRLGFAPTALTALTFETHIPRAGSLLLWEAYVTEKEREAVPDDEVIESGPIVNSAGPPIEDLAEYKDILDCVRAVRFGFCNDPKPEESSPSEGEVVPMASWVAPLVSSTVIVVAPDKARARLLWP